MSNNNVLLKFPRRNRFFEKGLDGGAIKILGIILMAMDHLHQMFVNQGAPLWLNWLGRPVAAMFLFLCAEGYYYTRSKTIYLLRFLGAFILMNLGNEILTKSFSVEDVALINNIFGTLCVSAFYMLMVDFFLDGIRKKNPSRILLALGGMLLPLIVGFALMDLLFRISPPSRVVTTLFFLIPTPVTVEGGIFQVAVGVAFYLLRTRRRIQALVPVAAGLFAALISRGESAQWLMVFAALPILLYNGRRGWGAKYFFYAFYPAHIYLLYLIAWFLQSRSRF
jgi:hypothetical protein